MKMMVSNEKTPGPKKKIGVGHNLPFSTQVVEI